MILASYHNYTKGPLIGLRWALKTLPLLAIEGPEADFL